MIAKGTNACVQLILRRHTRSPARLWSDVNTSKPNIIIEILCVNVVRPFLRHNVHLRNFDLALL